MYEFLSLCLVLCLGGAYGFAPEAQMVSHQITSEIRYHLATTRFTSTISYYGEIPTVFPYDVIIPSGAFLSNVTIRVSGVYYSGSVQERQEEAASPIREPGPDESKPPAQPRDTNLFTINVHLPPMSNSTVYVTYQEVLERRRGAYRSNIYISPRYNARRINSEVTIVESDDLSSLFANSPVSVSDMESESGVQIDRPEPNAARITYTPSETDLAFLTESETTDFLSFEYDVGLSDKAKKSGKILSYNGYFVHYLSPEVETAEPKDILFILDISSSMRVNKMDQLKSAMTSILEDLKPDDRFNIMTFNTRTDLWQEELLNASEENVKLAVDQVNEIFPSGVTNANDALVQGVEFMSEYAIPDRSIIIFLTDGRASIGVTDTTTILTNVKTANVFKIPIYSLGFGYGADWNFVRSIALQNNGQPRRIYESDDAPAQIVNFYSEVSTPVLRNVTVDYLRRVADGPSLTQTSFKTIYGGSEYIIGGKVARRNRKFFPYVVKGIRDGKPVSDKERANMEKSQPQVYEGFDFSLTPIDSLTETVWVYTTIRQLIREYETETDVALRAILRQRLVEFSIKYNLVTLVTSMLVPRPDQPGNNDELPQGDQAVVAVQPNLERGGINTAGGRDPHFMIKTAYLDDELCFDLSGEHVYQIIHDPATDLSVNIKLSHGHVSDGHGGTRKYISATGILMPNFFLRAYLDGIVVNGQKHSWKSQLDLKMNGFKVISHKNEKAVRVELASGFRVIIYKHLPAGEGDEFLNIELDREGRLSQKTTGLLGQFIHRRIVMARPHHTTSQKIVRFESGKNNNCLASLRMRVDPITKSLTRCWLLHTGKGIFNLPQSRFLLKSIKSSAHTK